MRSPSRYAVLFGFDLEDKDRTGYVRAGEKGCSVVDGPEDATEFPLKPDGEGSPKDWCEFFKGEPGLSGWRFHPVVMSRRPERPS